MSGFLRTASSKLAALVILAALAAGAWNWLAVPVSGRLLDAKDRIAEQRSLLGRLQQTAVMDKTLVAVEGQGAAGTSRAFLPGETDAIRIAGLQSTLNEAAAAANVRLASTRALEPSDKAGLHVLAIQAQLSANLDQVQKILFNLEKQRANLLVDTVHVARSPQAPGQGLPQLDVTFVLSGATPAQKGQP